MALPQVNANLLTKELLPVGFPNLKLEACGMNTALQALAAVPGLVDTILTETKDLKLENELQKTVVGLLHEIYGEYQIKSKLEALDDRRIGKDLHDRLWTKTYELFFNSNETEEFQDLFNFAQEFFKLFGQKLPLLHPRNYMDYFEFSTLDFKLESKTYEPTRNIDLLLATNFSEPATTSKSFFEGKGDKGSLLCGPPVLFINWNSQNSSSSTVSNTLDMTNFVTQTAGKFPEIAQKIEENAEYKAQIIPPKCHLAGQPLKYSLALIGMNPGANHWLCLRRTFGEGKEPQWYFIDDIPIKDKKTGLFTKEFGRLVRMENDRKEWPEWMRECTSPLLVYLRNDYFGIETSPDDKDVTDADIIAEKKYVPSWEAEKDKKDEEKTEGGEKEEEKTATEKSGEENEEKDDTTQPTPKASDEDTKKVEPKSDNNTSWFASLSTSFTKHLWVWLGIVALFVSCLILLILLFFRKKRPARSASL